MKPIVTEAGEAQFNTDPLAWFAWARTRMVEGDRESVTREQPISYEGRDGRRWRVIRTGGGIEIRPDLGAALRESRNPQVSAIQIDGSVTVELCSSEGRWTGVFSLDELDLAELGRAMLEERRLPHDNLRLLFGRGGR